MRYEHNPRGANRWLQHSGRLEAVLWRRAEQGAAYARSIAPYDPRRTHGQHYRDSIRVAKGAIRARFGGWAARQTVRIEATAGHAVAVEIGAKTNHRVRAHHVLARTADHITDRKRLD